MNTKTIEMTSKELVSAVMVLKRVREHTVIVKQDVAYIVAHGSSDGTVTIWGKARTMRNVAAMFPGEYPELMGTVKEVRLLCCYCGLMDTVELAGITFGPAIQATTPITFNTVMSQSQLNNAVVFGVRTAVKKVIRRIKRRIAKVVVHTATKLLIVIEHTGAKQYIPTRPPP